MAANAFADIKAVGIGQHDIEQNEVGTLPTAQVDCAFARLGADQRKSLFLEVVLEKSEEIGVVLYQCNFFHGTNLTLTQLLLRLHYKSVKRSWPGSLKSTERTSPAPRRHVPADPDRGRTK